MNDADFERSAQRAAAWMRTQAEHVAEPEAALTQLFAEEAGVDGPGQTRTVRTDRWRHRRRWAALASAAAVVALIIGVAVTGREQSQAPVLTSPTTTEPVPTATFTSPTSTAPATATSTPPTTQPPRTVAEGVVTVGQLRDLLDGPYESFGHRTRMWLGWSMHAGALRPARRADQFRSHLRHHHPACSRWGVVHPAGVR